MKRLAVVAADSLIVEAIRIGLRQRGEFELLSHIVPSEVSVQAIVDTHPDIVLVDDVGHAEAVIELVQQIVAASSSVAVIALSVDMDPGWLSEIFDAGATAAISKSTHPLALSTLIRETVEQHVVHIHRPTRGADNRDLRAVTAKDSSLTCRELEVLQLVAAGSTNGEIARNLWVTEQTVKFHLSNVYRKLDVGNRTQASHYAHINGLVEGTPVLLTT